MTEQSFLYDTGAQSIQKNLPNGQCKKTPGKRHIRDAEGNDLRYKGTYLVPMLLLGRMVMHDLVVLKKGRTKFWE
jgi:hypothetical protein